MKSDWVDGVWQFSKQINIIIEDYDGSTYGYTHWSHLPCNPDSHENYCLVPQSITDGWDIHCECGRFFAHGSFWDFDTKEGLLEALKKVHTEHKNKAEIQGCP